MLTELACGIIFRSCFTYLRRYSSKMSNISHTVSVMIADIWNCARLVYAIFRIFKHESMLNVTFLKIAASRCGTVGTKLLQFIMMHDGIISSDCKKHFQHVFEDCKTHDWVYTLHAYRRAFGHSLYDDFVVTPESTVPVGSGSIGQVYRLYSKSEGKHVAVKVKHPNIDRDAARFVRNIMRIMAITDVFYKIPFALIIREFLVNIQLQLDFRNEAANMDQLRKHFASEPHIVIPEVIAKSDDVIVMTYHKGVSFQDIQDKGTRARVSCDMFMFMAVSIVCYDFVHCDMHFGNWKVDPDTEQLIIYDCGIIGRTGRPAINDRVLKAAFDGDYIDLAYVVAPDFENHGPELKDYIKCIMAKHYPGTADRFADFLKKAFQCRVPIDKDVLRCIQGLIICISTIFSSSDKIMNIISSDHMQRRYHSEVFICYLNGLLERTGKYKLLNQKFAEWMRDDPTIEEKFYDWMENNFGHRDKDVFIDVLRKVHYPQAT